MVSFEANQYSVPEEYKGEWVKVYYCDHTLRILSNEGVILCKYTRCYGRNQKLYRVWNVLSKLQHKAAGFVQSREMRSMPRWLKRVFRASFLNAADEFIGFLALIKDYPKKTIKRMLRYHETFNIEMTLESVWTFLFCC